MANVAFRRGNQSTLPQNAVDGVFYYTRDTHKLYVGDGTTMVDLTHFVNYVDSQNDLNNVTARPGDIYYITGENILCIKNPAGQNPAWTQINPDTRLASADNAVTLSDTTVDGKKKVTVTTSVSDTGATPATATGNFSIVEGNSNVHITRNGNTITISTDNSSDDHMYSLGTVSNSTTGGTVKLTEKLGGTETQNGSTQINFVGSGDVTVTSSGSTGTGANTVTIDVPTQHIANGLAFNSSGVLTSSAELTTGANSNSSVTPTIKYGKPATAGGAQPESSVFVSGNASLDVYTTGQVDTLLSGIQASMDAMTYKGAIGASAAQTLLAGTAGKVGDTYKVSEDFTYGSGANAESFKAGDLIIAKGTDDNVTWDHIASGDDQMVGGAVNAAYFQVKDNLADQSLLKVNLNEQSSSVTNRAAITVTGTVNNAGSNGVGAEVTYVFAHGDAGTGTAQAFTTTATNMTSSNPTTANGLNQSINVMSISGISLDAAGHVASITTSKYAIQDTHNQIQSVSTSASVSSNAGTYGITVSNTDGDSASASFVLKTSTTTPTTGGGIQISRPSGAATNEMYIDFVWGEF